MMMDLVVLLNARSLFGEDLSTFFRLPLKLSEPQKLPTDFDALLVKDPQFMKSALGYVEETLLNAEIVKLLPKCMAPFVGGLLGRCLSSHKTFFRSLIPATEQRLAEKNLKNLGQSVPERVCALNSVLLAHIN